MGDPEPNCALIHMHVVEPSMTPALASTNATSYIVQAATYDLRTVVLCLDRLQHRIILPGWQSSPRRNIGHVAIKEGVAVMDYLPSLRENKRPENFNSCSDKQVQSHVALPMRRCETVLPAEDWGSTYQLKLGRSLPLAVMDPRYAGGPKRCVYTRRNIQRRIKGLIAVPPSKRKNAAPHPESNECSPGTVTAQALLSQFSKCRATYRFQAGGSM